MMSISVVIPAFNRKAEVARAIMSVSKQTLAASEIIVVDDASTDGTADFVIDNFPEVKVIKSQTNNGGAVSRNIGARNATGEFIAFLDSDDEWTTDHLEKKVSFMKAENADGVFGPFYLNDGKVLKEIIFGVTSVRKGSIGDLIFSNVRFDTRTSTFVFKRERFLDVMFDEALRKHQDWDLAINFERCYNFVLDVHNTAILHVDPGTIRMSHSLNTQATMLFLDKNRKFIKPANQFIFYLKMMLRAERAGDRKAYELYLGLAGDVRKHTSVTNRIIYSMLRTGIIGAVRLNAMRTLVSKLKG